MNKLILKEYRLKTPEVYSELKWEIKEKNFNYLISYPSNPELDVELMLLHEKKIKNVIIILSSYIRKNGYPKNVMDELRKFLKWIICSENPEETSSI